MPFSGFVQRRLSVGSAPEKLIIRWASEE